MPAPEPFTLRVRLLTQRLRSRLDGPQPPRPPARTEVGAQRYRALCPTPTGVAQAPARTVANHTQTERMKSSDIRTVVKLQLDVGARLLLWRLPPTRLVVLRQARRSADTREGSESTRVRRRARWRAGLPHTHHWDTSQRDISTAPKQSTAVCSLYPDEHISWRWSVKRRRRGSAAWCVATTHRARCGAKPARLAPHQLPPSGARCTLV